MKEKNKIILIILLLVLTILLFRLEKYVNKGKEVYQIDKETVHYTKEDSEFWIDKLEDKDRLLMNQSQIELFNRENFNKLDFLIELKDYKSNIIGDELVHLIKSISKLPEELRYDGKENIMDEDYFQRLISNLNLESIPDNLSVNYGITINRTMLRTFPTYEPSYKEKDDIHFDRFMETAIYPWEPLIIYWESKDGEWYFGRMYNYFGWIPRKDVAIGKKEEIFDTVNKEPFLVVIDKQIHIDDLLLDMGVRVPIAEERENSYIILIPTKDEKGQLEMMEKEVQVLEAFNKGYLPYTKENIIRQGFKFYGEKYGWGGIDNKRDCSAFIMDIHRTFGIKLPRNSTEQGMDSIGKVYDKDNMPPASVLYMPGHTMLFLGENEGIGYILHQFAGYYEEGEEGLYYIDMMKTAVSPLIIKTSSGITYMEMVSICKEFVID